MPCASGDFASAVPAKWMRGSKGGKLFHYMWRNWHCRSRRQPPWDETYNPAGRDKKKNTSFTRWLGKFGGTLSWYSHPEDDEHGWEGGTIGREQTFRICTIWCAIFDDWLFRPHTPFRARKYFEFHSIKDIVVPDREEKAWQNCRSLHNVRFERASQLRCMDTAKAIIQAYRASVSFVDAQVGRVLEALKDNGLEQHACCFCE